MKCCLVKPLNGAYIFNDGGATVSVGLGGERQPERQHHPYSGNFSPFLSLPGSAQSEPKE